MIHLDVKNVGVIPNGGGWRVHGRGTEQAKRQVDLSVSDAFAILSELQN